MAEYFGDLVDSTIGDSGRGDSLVVPTTTTSISEELYSEVVKW
jgi:hypothetical protein